jgi:thiosulfate dehydrogenase
MIRPTALLFVLVALPTCGDTPAAEAGEDKFNDPSGFSDSSLNRMSCATCHDPSEEPDPSVILPGYPLHGVVARSSWWGGQAATLLDAVNACIVYFMRGDELEPDEDAARQLYEYLLSITPPGSDLTPLPLTIVENIAPIPLGDAARGEVVYETACRNCHGELGSGAGGISEFILPDDMATYDEELPGVPKGLILIEVIRHGRFFGVGGQMPFFSLELLTDEQIGDLLAFLNFPSE